MKTKMYLKSILYKYIARHLQTASVTMTLHDFGTIYMLCQIISYILMKSLWFMKDLFVHDFLSYDYRQC